MEMIPGPDDRLCSHYTYLDESGEPQFHFTKRIIRRYPLNMGAATYHVTDHVPELRELALALLEQVGLRGFGECRVQARRAGRKVKLIQCNARLRLRRRCWLNAVSIWGGGSTTGSRDGPASPSWSTRTACTFGARSMMHGRSSNCALGESSPPKPGAPACFIGRSSRISTGRSRAEPRDELGVARAALRKLLRR